MIVFLNKIDVLDEKIHHGQRITKLNTFVANWFDAYELRKYNLAQYINNESMDSAGDSLHDSQLSSASAANDSSVFQSSFSKFSTGTPLRKIEEHALVEADLCENMSTARIQQNSIKRTTPQTRSKRFSFQSSSQTSSLRWNRSSFNRALSSLAPRSSSRKFRLSFRQASFLPITSSPLSSGQTSRLSCTVAVVRLILDNPYATFYPSDDEKREFSNAIQYIEYQADVQTGTDSSDLRELRLPHPETIRTACYVKHLFQNLVTQNVSSQLDRTNPRQCLFYYTCAVNTDSIKRALNDFRCFLIDGHMKRCGRG